MELSARAKALKPSPISAVFDQARALREAGVEIVDFSVGEPDFDTPEHICEAGKRAIDEGATRYTSVDGAADIKDAVIEKFARENGLRFSRSQIVVGSGAKPVLAVAVAAVAGAGDEVILPTPAWPSHSAMIELAGAAPKFVDCGVETGFKLTAGALEDAITPNSRLLILCSPSNPTGAVYGANELEALAKVLRKHPHLAVISDDLYEHIVFDGAEFATLAAIAPDIADRILTVNGVSKAYAMTGWRIGYAGGPERWARAIAGMFSQGEGSPCTISQKAAIAALRGDQSFLKDWAKIYQRRRDLLVDMISKAKGLVPFLGQGAFYVFVDARAVLGRKTPSGETIASTNDLARYLIENGVALTPGEAFHAAGFLRISIATSEAEIEKGAKRIVAAINNLANA